MIEYVQLFARLSLLITMLYAV